MRADRLRQWLASAGASFERGVVHEENLAYLLGSEFAYADAWRQAVSAFEWLVDNASRDPEPLILRAVVPLTEVAELVSGPIDPQAIATQVHPATPPSLIVMPPALAVDHRPFEEYRVALSLDVRGAAAWYSVGRSLDWTDEAWMRSIVLEHVRRPSAV